MKSKSNINENPAHLHTETRPNNTETESSLTYHLKLDYFFGADLKLQEISIQHEQEKTRDENKKQTSTKTQ